MAVVARVLSQRQELLYPGRPPLGPGLEVGDHQIAVEAIDTGRHRGVGREHQTRADPSEGGIDIASLDHPVDQLQRDESGMALVQMMYRGQHPSEARARAPPTPSTIS